MTSPLALCLPSVADRNHPRRISPNGLGAWDLTSDARPTFYIFLLDPINQSAVSAAFRQEPTTTLRYRMDDKPCDLPYPLAVLLASSRGLRSFRSPVTDLPSHPTHHRMLTLNRHRKPSDWRLLLAANLEPLPPSLDPYSLSGFTARCRSVATST